MAIRVTDEFGSRANPPDSAYPDGSLKNETNPGVSNDGSPLEARVGNDWEGFKQSVLSEAEIVANGNPDSVDNPQILDAVKKVQESHASTYTDIVYKSSGGLTAIDNMISGFPVQINIGEICQCEGGTRFERIGNANGDIRDFNPRSSLIVEDFGCVADNGVTDNRIPFIKIKDYLIHLGGNAIVEFSGAEEPYVYYQYKGPDDSERYYGLGDIFRFDVGDILSNVIFRGNKCKIKLGDGCHFGSFDPITGDPTGIQTEGKYANGGGRFFWFTGQTNIRIENLSWDGNVSNHIIGGEFGDTGYQISEYGLLLHGESTDVSVENCDFSHSGLDGFAVGVTHDVHIDPNISFTNVTSRFNGRQAFSLVGGSNMLFTNCNFTDTGRDTIASLPRSGLDIEPEMGPCFYNTFISCNFANNVGPGVLCADTPSSVRDNQFIDCNVIGTTATPIFLQTGGDTRPPATFRSCTIKGAVEVSGGWYFNCDFNDLEDATYPDIYTSNYYFDAIKNNCRQENCTYTITQSMAGGLWFNQKGVKDAKVYAYFNSDTHTGSFLGIVGELVGDIELYDRTTGSTKRNICINPSAGKGNIRLAEDGGNVNSRVSSDIRAGNPQYAEDARAVTSLLITANESVDVGTAFGATKVSVIFSNNPPTSGEYLDGDIVYKYQFAPGGTLGWVCTTSGTAGSTAVFKSFGQVEV